MPSSAFVGKAGHLAVMSEFAFRGYNVAMPEIDLGDDVFVVNDKTGSLWRIQVKTSRSRVQKKSEAFQFRIRDTAITTPQSPDLHFVFVMRSATGWRYLVLQRSVLQNYVVANKLGSLRKGYRRIYVTVTTAGVATSAGLGLSHHLGDWSHWPAL